MTQSQYIAVLCSGGLDSAVLLADVAREGVAVPVYVSVGFAWEAEERRMLARLLEAAPLRGRVADVGDLAFDMRDVFPPTHWAVAGRPPAFDTPDEDVYLDGRNVILLSKTAVYMARNGITRVAMGPLAGNPFPDATPQFFDAMARALSLGLEAPISIYAPFADMTKADVIRIGRALGVPFELTLSCMQPKNGRHCGRCSKCRERIEAFREAGETDPAALSLEP